MSPLPIVEHGTAFGQTPQRVFGQQGSTGQEDTVAQIAYTFTSVTVG
jgi:hypothetical protein